MMMEQGSSALRSEPMWHGGESSSEIGLFTGQPWLNRRLNSTLLVEPISNFVRRPKIARPARLFFAKFPSASMKAKIIITPKKAVVDPQGKTVQGALEQMGYKGVIGVHVGKYIEIDLAPGTDQATTLRALNDAAHKFLSNPIIEDYKLEIE
jgi:phosphoribosylformylglycinamidine synthase